MGLGIFTFVHSQLPLFIYIFCIVSCVLALAGRLQVGIYYLLFILPFAYTLNKVHKYPLGNQVLDFIFISLALGTLIYQTKKIRSPSSTPILLHIAIVLLSFLYGFINEGSISFGEFGHSFRLALVKDYLTMPLLYWITLGFIQERDSESRTRTIVYFILFMVAIVDWRFWDSFRWKSHAHFSDGLRDQAFGSLGTNHLAAFVVEYTAIAISLLFYDSRKKAKSFFLVVMAASVYPILYSYSRAGYVAIVAVLLWNFLFKKKVFIAILVGGLLIGGAAINYLPKSVVERVTMTETDNGNLDSSANTRLIIWEQGKELFLSNPLFGIGYQMVPGYIDVHGLRNLHNYIFQMLVETGIIGFSVFVYLLFSAFRSGWRLFVQSTDTFYKGLGLGFCGCVLASVVCNFFGDRWSFPQMQGYWWVFWAVCDSKLYFISEISSES